VLDPGEEMEDVLAPADHQAALAERVRHAELDVAAAAGPGDGAGGLGEEDDHLGRAQVGLADLRVRGDEPIVDTLVLDGDQPATLYIPAGVAHGFLAMTAVDLIYWVTREYDATDEYGIAWNDPTLGIRWRTERPVVSERDRQNPDLEWDSIPSFS